MLPGWQNWASVMMHWKSRVYLLRSYRSPVLIIAPSPLAEYNGVRAHIHYQMLDAQSGEPYAEGESLHCFLGNSGRPVNLRRALPAFDAILHPLVAPPEPSQNE